MAKPPAYPDHIGWDLVRAAELWQRMFRDRMVALGHDWYGAARGRLMQHIGPSGITQADLARRTGHSKQAIQQMIDVLEAEGVVARHADARDKRQKRVVLADRGLAFQSDGVRVKAQIEAEIAAMLGPKAFGDLKDMLKSLLACRAR